MHSKKPLHSDRILVLMLFLVLQKNKDDVSSREGLTLPGSGTCNSTCRVGNVPAHKKNNSNLYKRDKQRKTKDSSVSQIKIFHRQNDS